jgi:hypothetical protein
MMSRKQAEEYGRRALRNYLDQLRAERAEQDRRSGCNPPGDGITRKIARPTTTKEAKMLSDEELKADIQRFHTLTPQAQHYVVDQIRRKCIFTSPEKAIARQVLAKIADLLPARLALAGSLACLKMEREAAERQRAARKGIGGTPYRRYGQLHRLG